ncbi:MAG: polymer-forming cytoskeletal protein [Coriobacteriia bacterium]|nr:polymer-forming cytoskeletal protein [Coriobacteriia bacterium]
MLAIGTTEAYMKLTDKDFGDDTYYLGETLEVEGDLDIETPLPTDYFLKEVRVSGNLTCNSSLLVVDSISVEGDMRCKGSVKVDGKLEAGGLICSGYDVMAVGEIFAGTVQAEGDVHTNGSIDVDGDILARHGSVKSGGYIQSEAEIKARGEVRARGNIDAVTLKADHLASENGSVRIKVHTEYQTIEIPNGTLMTGIK